MVDIINDNMIANAERNVIYWKTPVPERPMFYLNIQINSKA